jgi:methylmalonyl-CoA/ethylmalonyl-CoA epimerase
MQAVALDHVGIAVPSATGHRLVQALGGEPLELVEMRSGVAVARFGPGRQLELVVPARPGSPIERFLARRGPGLHHVGFEVDEPLLGMVEGLRASGFEPIGDIEPASDGRPSLFLHPSSTGGVLVELVEGPRSTCAPYA